MTTKGFISTRCAPYQIAQTFLNMSTFYVGVVTLNQTCAQRSSTNSVLFSFVANMYLSLQVACFPFQTNNCPPLQLVSAFCEAVHTWLKAGLENVVVVHCKGGMARTGLMISCLLLHLNVRSSLVASSK